MRRRTVIVRAMAVLLLVWAGVWAVRSVAATKRITAERVSREIVAADFADWSDSGQPHDPALAERRGKDLRRIADMINRLDFAEREKNRRNREGEEFFRRLSAGERSMFIDLTIGESMNRFMEALDAMPPEQRRQFVEQGLREVEEGRTAEDLDRAGELGEDLVRRISEEGIRAYFEKSSAETKLDLAPLMEAVNETMQGLRGNEFAPPRQN